MTRSLVLWLTGASAAFWLAAAGLGIAVMQDEMGEIFDSALQETAERLMPLVVDDLFQQEANGQARSLQESLSSDEYLTYQVRDAAGRVLLHSHDVSRLPFDAPLAAGFWEDGNRRIFTISAVSNTVFLQVADSMAHRSEAAMEGGLALLLPVVLLVPINILLVVLIVRRVVSPVDDLRRAISQKDGGNLAELDLVGLPRELEPIETSVNLLLRRLRSALASEREFTANSAHELRTPIAGALAQTQRLIASLKAGPALDRARNVEESLKSLSKLTEKLLQLARAEAGIGSGEASVDLLRILDIVVDDMERASASPTRIKYVRDPSQTLLRRVNPDAFAIVMRNLIENALSHGAKGAPIEVRVLADDTVVVFNDADVVPWETLQRIRGRFSRGPTTVGGSGLGLSIVDSLLTQMGGMLDLHSPAAGRADGFEARVVIRPDSSAHT